MTAPTQGEVRSWARAEGMAVNERGSLSAAVVSAYVAAHASKPKASVTAPARKAGTRRSKPAAKAAPRRRRAAAPAKRAAAPAKRVRPAAVRSVSETAGAPEVAAPPAGTTDLAAGLRTYLAAVEAEVRAVSVLSERIDALVSQLNDVRDEQAKRLLVLDELRASVSDASLGAFLNQAIKPRKVRVREVVPDRLA